MSARSQHLGPTFCVPKCVQKAPKYSGVSANLKTTQTSTQTMKCIPPPLRCRHRDWYRWAQSTTFYCIQGARIKSINPGGPGCNTNLCRRCFIAQSPRRSYRYHVFLSIWPSSAKCAAHHRLHKQRPGCVVKLPAAPPSPPPITSMPPAPSPSSPSFQNRRHRRLHRYHCRLRRRLVLRCYGHCISTAITIAISRNLHATAIAVRPLTDRPTRQAIDLEVEVDRPSDPL